MTTIASPGRGTSSDIGRTIHDKDSPHETRDARYTFRRAESGEPRRGQRGAHDMTIRDILRISLAIAWSLSAPTGASAIPAFPGAEGFGAATPGGRGGEVIEVTNLNDSGPGSLREAMEVRTGPRTVVFRVGGTITLTGPIEVREPNSYLTVAGQTAPGDGVQIKNYGINIRDGAHDVVLRYLRVRPGDTTPGVGGKDGVLVYGEGTRPVHNVVVDHCSIEWATDENVDVWAWV